MLDAFKQTQQLNHPPVLLLWFHFWFRVYLTDRQINVTWYICTFYKVMYIRRRTEGLESNLVIISRISSEHYCPTYILPPHITLHIFGVSITHYYFLQNAASLAAVGFLGNSTQIHSSYTYLSV